MNDTQKYSKEFYSMDTLKQAKKDYMRIARIVISEDKDYFYCEFTNCAVEAGRVINEFNNYLIELMNSRKNGNET